MTGATVKYWEGRTPPPEYYAPPFPGNNAGVKIPFNVKKVCEYAHKVGKELTELTKTEIDNLHM